MDRARSVEPPADTLIATLYDDADLADAFAIALKPEDARLPAEVLALAMMAKPPMWSLALLAIRDAVMGVFGVKSSRQILNDAIAARADHIGMFRILARRDHEVVLGENDRHLDFRLSVMTRPSPSGGVELVATSIAHCHNRLGQIYLTAIMPFHKLIVRASLVRAARADNKLQTAMDQGYERAS
ncbi:DUF2867 domain-containing protein [Caulobacter sp. NIBR2454]|uniref:DUF2867 domain-containing protein n=1 Tax=Caulobacter sp. NIBR2454 TaxID=3015996 RepID=UPI0022B72552|nr:DUF2867 domain-containing protein [Caulobacter sp. NIBR2454]